MPKIMGHPEWSPKKKLEVVQAQILGLKAPEIQAATGVPAATIRYWRMQDWFKEMVAELQTEDDLGIDARFTKILAKSLDVMSDRLDNGDYQYDPKTGKFVRKPVSARDSRAIVETMFDKRNVLRGKPTSITARQEQVSDRLLKLASEFERFVSARDVTPDAIQITETEALHARETPGHSEEVGVEVRVDGPAPVLDGSKIESQTPQSA